MAKKINDTFYTSNLNLTTALRDIRTAHSKLNTLYITSDLENMLDNEETRRQLCKMKSELIATTKELHQLNKLINIMERAQ